MQFLTWINRWKQRDNYKLELAAVITLKLSFLFLLWHLCFSDPLGDHLNDQKMASHIVESQ